MQSALSPEKTQELSNNMQIVTDAISREDWEQVAELRRRLPIIHSRR